MKIHGWKGACIALLLTCAIPAIAQEEKSTATGNFKMLTWAQEDPIDWSTGGLFALLGMIGALTTIFGFINGAKTPRSRSGSQRSKILLSTKDQSLVDEREAFEKLKSKAIVINKL